MSAFIDLSNGRENMAFVGSRNDIWHRMGNQVLPGASQSEMAKAAGLEFKVIKCPLWANIADLGLYDANGLRRGIKVDDRAALVRNDTGAVLGIAAEGAKYNIVQPNEVLDWAYRYVGVDDRFQIDTAGSLKGGSIIWVMATYREKIKVAGDDHFARMFMSTSFDTTQATINRGTMLRTVCWNTLQPNVAKGGEKSVVRTRHSTRFDAAQVSRELSQIVSGFQKYKAMGDAMLEIEMSKAEISNYFKALLDIPFDAKQDDISTRKLNQFEELKNSYSKTLQEGTRPGSQWAALNAVTRYVDHSKSTRGGENAAEARVMSAEFGSGAAMKAKAVRLLIGTDGREIEEEYETNVPGPAPVGPVVGGNLSAALDMMGV